MMRVHQAWLVAAVLAVSPAYADEAYPKPTAGVSQNAQPLSEGEVRRVDKDAKKITIRHGPLANLDMPAMTMVFQVRDPALLDKVKAGDQVKFRAEKDGAAYIVTKIEP